MAQEYVSVGQKLAELLLPVAEKTQEGVLKAMDVLADLLKAQENNDLEEAKLSAKLLQDVIKQQGIE